MRMGRTRGNLCHSQGVPWEIPWAIPAPWKCPQRVPRPLRTSCPWMLPPRSGDSLGQKGSLGKGQGSVPPKRHPGCPQHPKSDGEHRRRPSIPPTCHRAAEPGETHEWSSSPCLGAVTQIPTGVGGTPKISHREGLDPPHTPQRRRRVGAFTDFNLVLFLETKKKPTQKKKKKIKRHQTPPILCSGVQRLLPWAHLPTPVVSGGAGVPLHPGGNPPKPRPSPALNLQGRHLMEGSPRAGATPGRGRISHTGGCRGEGDPDCSLHIYNIHL